MTKILIDGSNILFWQGDQTSPHLPVAVVRTLLARRFAPMVYFDHSICRHMTDAELAALADLAPVVVALRGTPADVLLLDACKAGRHQIVSNDRFREWRGRHPQLRADWLVTGRTGKGGLISFSKKLRPAKL
jgi:hypothetical protein